MDSLIKCKVCGKKPRTLTKAQQKQLGQSWESSSLIEDVTGGIKSLGSTPAKKPTAKPCATAECDQSRVPGKPYCATCFKNVQNLSDRDPGVEDAVTSALLEVYEYFLKRAPKSEAMDSAKFVKMLTALEWLDGRAITRTDADLQFTKSKPKGGRRLDFEQFLHAINALAKKKYPNEADSTMSLLQSAKMPQMGRESETSEVVDRLTNSKHYTGAHKARFDEEGKGKGIEGRDTIAVGKGVLPARKVISSGRKVDLSEITRGGQGRDSDRSWQ